MSARRNSSAKKVRGVVITPNGEVSPVEIDNTVRALWDVVGGDVERIPLRDGADLFATRESRGLPVHRNSIADELIQRYGRRPTRMVVVGTALVLGEVTPSGDSTDVPEWMRKYVNRENPDS